MLIKSISSYVVAFILSALCAAGAIRVIFDVGQWIYGPFVVILIILCMYSFIGNVSLKKFYVFYFILIMMLISWLIFSVFWTSSITQWREDLQLLIYIAALIFSIFLLVDYNIIHKFLFALVMFGVLVGVFIIAQYGGIYDVSGYGTQVNEAYLTLATPVGMSFIVSTIFAIYSKHNRIFWIVTAIFLMISLSLSLSRGTLVFSIFVLCLLPVFHFLGETKNLTKKIKEIIKKYIFYIVPLIFGLLFLALNVERTASRLKRMLSPAKELMAGGRGELWSNSWEAITSSPILGYGLGSNGLLASGSEGAYPHNFILQVWLDGGLVAVIFTVFVLSIPLLCLLKSLKQFGVDPHLLSLISIFILLLLEYSKSSNFYTSRSLFIIASLSIIYFYNQKKYLYKKSK